MSYRYSFSFIAASGMTLPSLLQRRVAQCPGRCQYVNQYLTKQCEEEKNKIKINVIGIAAVPCQLSVTLDTQIKTLKELIWEKVGILPRRQQLAFDTLPLENDE